MAEAVAVVWNIATAAFSGTAFGTAQAGTALAVANATAQFAANVTLALAVNAVVANNTKPKDQGSLIDLTLDSAAPRRMVIGKRMTGGVLVDWYLAGTNNTKLYLPVYLSEGPCGQITRVFAGGREVWTTPLVHGVRTTIPDFRSGGDRLWLTYYDGRVGQTADPTLVALSQGWTSANKMEGCAYVVIECQWDSDNLRSPPQLTFEMEGAKLYDRRLDTTAGGSGSHRIDDPSTWAWTDNPMVALDHFLLGRYLDGQRTFGIGLSADEVPYARFAAQANVCDEDVDLQAGSTQKRYRANGIVFANDDYASTITKLCTAMAARPADFGGRFGVIGIESRTPVLTIDDADVIADSSETYTPKRSWSDLVGAVEGRYQDPAQLYQPVDFPRVTDAAWEAEDGGEPKVLTLELEFETNVERAQRLALLKARAERRQATLKGIYPLWTIELERGDWFIRTGAKWGEDGKTFEVIERILNTENFTVSIVAQEVDASDSAWDESTAQDGPPAPIASTDTLSVVAAPSLTVTSNSIVGTNSNTPAIKVAFTNPLDPRVHTLFIEVIRVSDGLKVATVPVTVPDESGDVIIQNGIADGEDYTVRAKYLTPGLQSEWSTEYAVTSSDIYAAGSVLDGSDIADMIDAALAAAGGDAPAQVFPGFAIVGGHGDIEATGNVAAASSIGISAGYFDHPTLGKVDVAETYFATPWGTLFAPPGGWFAVIWSEEATEDRFTNLAGSGHFFPACYVDGEWIAYKLNRLAGEAFEPELTDVVVARAIKPADPENPDISTVDGVTEVINFIRETQVVNNRFETIEVIVGDPDDDPDDEGSIFARYNQLIIVQADETESRVAAITTLTADLGTANAAISTNATAIANQTTALSSLTTSVNASFATANAAISTNATAISTANSAIATLETEVTARLDDAEAAITTNATAIATADAAIATLETEVTARLDDAEASITTNATAIATADAAIATLETEVTARLDAAEASITTNATAIATESAARATLETTLEARLDDAEADISTTATALATTDVALASLETTLGARIDDAEAEIAINATAIATESAARASLETTLEARIEDAEAAISTNATAIATADAAISTLETAVEARLDDAEAAITTNATAIATESAARAYQDSVLSASIGGVSASVSTNASAITTLDGKLSASYALTVDGNGRIAQMKLLSNGSTSAVKFTADVFQIFNGTTDYAPFEVVGGVVKIKSAAIGNLVADNITTGTLNVDRIADGDIDTPKITPNAVTAGDQTEEDGSQTTTTSWANTASIEDLVVASGEEVDLWFSLAASGFNPSSSGDTGSVLQWRVLRNSTEIYAPTELAALDAEETAITINDGGIAGLYSASYGRQAYAHPGGMDFDTPGAGTHDYHLQVRHVGDRAWTVKNRRIKAVLRKR